MLTKWLEMEKDGATKEEITYILEGLKMSKALEGVFNNSQNKIMSTEDHGMTIAICFIEIGNEVHEFDHHHHPCRSLDT